MYHISFPLSNKKIYKLPFEGGEEAVDNGPLITLVLTHLKVERGTKQVVLKLILICRNHTMGVMVCNL